MRRGRKASIPVSSVVPASRRRGSSASEPEASLDSSSCDASAAAASDTNSQGDPSSVQLPESGAAPGRAEEPPATPEPAFGSQAQSRDLLHGSVPPPFFSPESADGTRSSAVKEDTMLNIFRSIPTQMDYKGQKLAEQIFQGIILVSAIVGFIYGYITEQFGWTVYIVMAGFALSCLLTLPPWPIYRRNPLKWLPVQEPATDDKKPADRKVKRHSKN
uniref:Signal peptidase complex subunit 1 n=1 Tax=Salvator merianae TaxID=96440 RepID=A0A8D0C964_SALMN